MAGIFIIHTVTVECRQVCGEGERGTCGFLLICENASDMAIRYNPSTLEKIEKLVDEAGYIIRYERGTFQSGFCILEQRKVVVLNKFLQTEGRINTLIDLIPQLDFSKVVLTNDSQKLYGEVMAEAASNKVQ
jgi:hypothetical protein